MSVMQLVVGWLLPPITLAVLLVGVVLRIRQWYRVPTGKITLYPSAKTQGQLWAGIAKQVLLFRSLWDGNRNLWAGSWVFHVSLVLIFIGHFRVPTDFPLLWATLGMGKADVDAMSALTGGILGIVILAAGLYLLARRFLSLYARQASRSEDYVVLALFLIVILTGDAMRFLMHFDLSETREYFASLLSLKVPRVPDNPFFLTHFLTAQLLIMYIPLGKLLHIPGLFLAHGILREE